MYSDRVDEFGDDCNDYMQGTGWCLEDYDTESFTANIMCCGCGGGVLRVSILEPYQPPKICVDTNHDQVNSDGYSCSYIKLLHDNENIAYD